MILYVHCIRVRWFLLFDSGRLEFLVEDPEIFPLSSFVLQPAVGALSGLSSAVSWVKDYSEKRAEKHR